MAHARTITARQLAVEWVSEWAKKIPLSDFSAVLDSCPKGMGLDQFYGMVTIELPATVAEVIKLAGRLNDIINELDVMADNAAAMLTETQQHLSGASDIIANAVSELWAIAANESQTPQLNGT